MQNGNYQIVIFMIVVTVMVVLLVSIIITILYVHQNRRISFNEHLANTQLEIQEETFEHISREIHDNIGLSLTLAKLQLNTLTIESQQHQNIIESSAELIGSAIHDLSYISKSLNSTAIQNEGFLSAIKIKLEQIRNAKHCKVCLQLNGTSTFLDSQTELIVYRIAQEALNNIIKHSHATEIIVTLNYRKHELLMEIKDNGIGIDWQKMEIEKSTKMNAGLNNMKKRAKMINGNCEIKSNHKGTKVSVTIPFHANEK